MTTYLTIMVGDRPDRARPLLASSDSTVVGAALRAIMSRIDGQALLEGLDVEPGHQETREEAADGID